MTAQLSRTWAKGLATALVSLCFIPPLTHATIIGTPGPSFVYVSDHTVNGQDAGQLYDYTSTSLFGAYGWFIVYPGGFTQGQVYGSANPNYRPLR